MPQADIIMPSVPLVSNSRSEERLFLLVWFFAFGNGTQCLERDR